MDIENYIRTHQLRIETVLGRQLEAVKAHSRLADAMHYGVFNGGKRLRPVLAYASAEALGVENSCADIPACAVELVHSYSLIHDDLPAMDDDKLRRGKPTCHIVFDEATAILAGDALQCLAFELLADSEMPKVVDRVRLQMITALSHAIGWKGMVAGQSLDFSASGSLLDEIALAAMHGMKTGELIRASVKLGALSTGIANSGQLDYLDHYARCIGLAFQVRDDILDVTSDSHTLGKEAGRDLQLQKPTYPSMLGIKGAEKKAEALCEEGISVLNTFGTHADPLRELARYVVSRNH